MVTQMKPSPNNIDDIIGDLHHQMRKMNERAVPTRSMIINAVQEHPPKPSLVGIAVSGLKQSPKLVKSLVRNVPTIAKVSSDIINRRSQRLALEDSINEDLTASETAARQMEIASGLAFNPFNFLKKKSREFTQPLLPLALGISGAVGVAGVAGAKHLFNKAFSRKKIKFIPSMPDIFQSDLDLNIGRPLKINNEKIRAMKIKQIPNTISKTLKIEKRPNRTQRLPLKRIQKVVSEPLKIEKRPNRTQRLPLKQTLNVINKPQVKKKSLFDGIGMFSQPVNLTETSSQNAPQSISRIKMPKRENIPKTFAMPIKTSAMPIKTSAMPIKTFIKPTKEPIKQLRSVPNAISFKSSLKLPLKREQPLSTIKETHSRTVSMNENVVSLKSERKEISKKKLKRMKRAKRAREAIENF